MWHVACGRWQSVDAVTADAAAHPLESIWSSTVFQVITAKDFHIARCTLHMQLLLCYSYVPPHEHTARACLPVLILCCNCQISCSSLYSPCPLAMLDIWISMGLVGAASPALSLQLSRSLVASQSLLGIKVTAHSSNGPQIRDAFRQKLNV